MPGDARELRRLHGEADADVALLPGQFPLVSPGSVEVAAAPHEVLQHLFLLRGGGELVLVGVAHALLFPTHLFCLLGKKPAATSTS
jgi:hypothetical protein